MSAPPTTCANCGAPVELPSVADAERDTSRLRDLIRAAVREGAVYTCGTTTCLHPRCAAGRALMDAGKC